MGNRYGFKESFGEWCKRNDRQDILDLWDYEKNIISPFDVPYRTKLKYYFKCHNGIHDSESKRIVEITDKPNHRIICKQCESEGFYKKDLTGMVFGELTVLGKDDEKSNNKNRVTYYFCRCSCGRVVSADEYKLQQGKKCTCGGKTRHIRDKNDSPQVLADLRRSPAYYQFRRAVMEKDDYRCIITGEKCRDIEVHHLYPFATFPQTRFDPRYGVCVSKEYHSTGSLGSFHDVYGRYDNTPEQFQDYVNSKRKELGINEYFDVYEYMNSFDSDNLEIDDTMLDLTI